MAKKVSPGDTLDNPSHEIVKNKEIPDERRPEGPLTRTDIPNRKHDTREYHDPARSAVYRNSQPVAPNLDDLGPGLTSSATEVDLALDPDAARIETDPNTGTASEVKGK